MRVTLNQVAQVAGVSKAAVSYALSASAEKRRKVSNEMRERILSVASQLGYHPSILARGLAESRSYNVALLLPERCANSIDSNYLMIFHGVTNALLRSEYTLSVYFGCNEKFLSNVRSGRVDGILVICRLCHSSLYSKLSSLGVPVVFLDGIPDEARDTFGSVVSDMEGWLHGCLESFQARGLSKVQLFLKMRGMNLKDEQLSRVFPGYCQEFGMEGQVIYSDTVVPLSKFSEYPCGRIFRGETAALRAWLAHGRPGQDCSFMLVDAFRAEFLSLPLVSCGFYSSETIGSQGVEMLLGLLSGKNGPQHRRIAIEVGRSSYVPVAPPFEF